MSRSRLIASAAILACAGGVASAATIKLGNPGWGRQGSGGEFRVHSVAGFAGLSGFAGDAEYATAGQAGSWGTFCIELSENISLGTTYKASVAKWAVLGGAVTSNHGPQAGGAGTDDLEYETAFLYDAFRKGLLDDYQAAAASGAFGGALDGLADAAGAFDYAGDYVGAGLREDDTYQLQGAIWTFEEGTNAAITKVVGAMESFLIALAQFQTGQNGSWGQTIGNVRVMNLNEVGPNGAAVQSQLTIIPLPTAGGMSLAGLLTVLAVRRRVRV